MESLSLNLPDAAQVTTMTDQVFETLYAAVISLELPPGTKVSEAEIAKRLDVSRQPVRDAFFRLSKLGFLTIRPQRATIVTKISVDAVLKAAFIRSALEVACLRAAIEVIDDDDIAGLAEMLERQTRAAEAGERALFHDLDDAFHHRLCKIGGHEYVWTMIKESKAHMDRVRFLSLSFNARSALSDHYRLFESIKAGDVEEAVERLKDHLSRIREHVVQIRQDHGQYFEDEE